MAPMTNPVASSTRRKWWVKSTGTFTAFSIRAWSQLAATVPVQKARPHSGSYSFRFWGGSAGGRKPAIHGGNSLAAFAAMPAQLPMLHWSPRYLDHIANIGPMDWRIECP